ncbi:MAG: penicillin-binding protein activator [Candidatus Zixiibacteriota bacterium]
MVKSIKYILIIFAVLLMLAGGIYASEAEATFDNAYHLMQDGNYAEAFHLLSRLCLENTDSDNLDRYLFFRGKCEYYLGNFSTSLNTLADFNDHFKNSGYLPYAEYFTGNNYYRLEKPDRALRAYFQAYNISADAELDRLILQSISEAASTGSSTILTLARSSSIPEAKRCDLLVAIGKTLFDQGNYPMVKNLLSSCSTAEAQQLISRADMSLRKKVEIGIALPLSGDLQRYGEQILDGIRLRIKHYQEATGKVLNPVIYDTRGDNMEAARAVKKMSDDGLTAVIGPLTSDAAALASAVLSCTDMPLVIPAASQSGLTELSPSSFQLQPNLEWQGLRMADFAVQRLKADTAAIITPATTDYMRMARAFKNRFEELGGTILGVESFRPKETDFGPYVRDLKSLILGDLLDSIFFINDNGDTIDAEEVPVWIDCIFIPAEAGQLRQLLPQINFYNLNTTYLGGDGWGSSSVYNLGTQVTRDCYFSSGLLGNMQSEEAVQFAAEFDREHGRQAGRLEALGYDAMSLICEALANDNYSREEIGLYLSHINMFQGLAGMVTFGEHRENIELPIYTVENEQPVRVVLE